MPPDDRAPVLADPLASLAEPSTSGLTNYGSVNLTGGDDDQSGIYKEIRFREPARSHE